MKLPSEFQGDPYKFSSSRSEVILQPESAVWGLSILLFIVVLKDNIKGGHIVLPQ